jgi:hypothetical protein
MTFYRDSILFHKNQCVDYGTTCMSLEELYYTVHVQSDERYMLMWEFIFKKKRVGHILSSPQIFPLNFTNCKIVVLHCYQY